eukprot:m.26402 g.26402  ORF g.26402 m.26402 type:complete len:579 (+) comp8935_c0_seq1:55-1791(+)
MRGKVSFLGWAGCLTTIFACAGATCTANFFLGLNLSAPSNYSCQPCTVCASVSTPCTNSSDTVCAAASESRALATSWIILIAVLGGALLLILLSFLLIRARRNHRTQPTNSVVTNANIITVEKKSSPKKDKKSDNPADIQLRPKKEPQKLSLLQRLSSARSASTTASTDGGYVQVETLPDYISCPLKPTRGTELSAFDRDALFAVFGDQVEGESSFGFPASREGSFVRHQSFGFRDSFGFPESLLEEESVLETKGLAGARTIDLSPEPRGHDSSTEVFSPVMRLPPARGSAELRSQTHSPLTTTPSPVPSGAATPAAVLLHMASPPPDLSRASSVPLTPSPPPATSTPRPAPTTAGGIAVAALDDASSDAERWRALRTLRELLGNGPDSIRDCVEGGAVAVLCRTLHAANDSPDVLRETALCLKMLVAGHGSDLIDGGVLDVLAAAAAPDTEAQEDLMQAFATVALVNLERAEPLLEDGLLTAMLRVLGRAAAAALVAFVAPLARVNPGLVTAAGGAKTLLALPMFTETNTAEQLLDALTTLSAHMALPGVQVLAKTYKSHPNSKVRSRAAALAAAKQ